MGTGAVGYTETNILMTLRPWHVLGLVLVVCVSAVLGASWWRQRTDRGIETFAENLPKDVQTLVRIDFEALRMGGYLDALAGEATDQDSDYRRFVEQTGFDFRRDLEAVVVGISPAATYVFASGDFDWKTLKEYTFASGGACRNAFCRMQSSTPSRWISFFPHRPRVMALAASPDAWAAASLAERGAAKPVAIPAEYAVWLRAPGNLVAESTLIPSALRPIAGVWASAEQVEFSVGGARGLEIGFQARCATAEIAQSITARLTEATKAIPSGAPEGAAEGGAALVEVLRSGRFETRDRVAAGSWRVPASVRLNPGR